MIIVDSPLTSAVAGTGVYHLLLCQAAGTKASVWSRLARIGVADLRKKFWAPSPRWRRAGGLARTRPVCGCWGAVAASSGVTHDVSVSSDVTLALIKPMIRL